MNNGGHAFPNITPDMNVDGGPGMTLRDYFAASVLPSLVFSTDTNGKSVARFAYIIADAMLAERQL